jgi:hypothetical protein
MIWCTAQNQLREKYLYLYHRLEYRLSELFELDHDWSVGEMVEVLLKD